MGGKIAIVILIIVIALQPHGIESSNGICSGRVEG